MGCCGDDGDSSEDGKYGKAREFDPDFKGPMKNRSCTDILCCLLFFVFILGYIVIGIFAWLNGDPIMLLYPTDNQGRICGVDYTDLNLQQKQNLFYFDITQCGNPASLIEFQCATTQICVQSCPNDTWTYILDIPKIEAGILAANLANTSREGAAVQAETNFFLDWSKYICTYGFNVRNEFVNNNIKPHEAVLAGKCAPYYMPMTPVVGRCIPQILKDAANEVAMLTNQNGVTVPVPIVDANNNTINGTTVDLGTVGIKLYLEARQIADKIFADVTSSWYWLLALIGISAVVAFLWIVIMRWVAGIMVWVTLIGIIAALTFGTWYCADEYVRLLTVPGANQSLVDVGLTTNLDTYLSLTDTWLAFAIILGVIDLIIILVVLFLRKRIQIAIQVIRQASKAIGYMISTLFYPLVTFLLVLIVVSFWAATALFLASTGDPQYVVSDQTNVSGLEGTTCNVLEWANSTHQYYLNDSIKCVFLNYGGTSLFHQNVIWLQVIEAFGMLWIMNWVLALGQCSLAGAFASYYWAFKKPADIPYLPLYTSFGRALRYHTGSLAFGALIIAIVQMIRILLEYADHKLKGTENKVAKFVLKCLKCCFWCLEKFLKFLNRNAYIMVAVYGKNFCVSAKNAFKLLMRNILRVAVVDKVTDFILFVGKLIVTVGMGALSWAFFTNKFSEVLSFSAPNLNYYWMPIIIIGVSAYFVAAGFFNTFGMAVDTIFLCFLEDLERNDGSEQKPYYMSKGLMKVLGKKNKKRKDSDS
uniref:Choline transporter-like protein n=1 Tax=Phallusia mammillata TaxID=59560 RepID=A0A6F9DTD7_9ASCI|nr:choline transporter-like protein 5 [Phallusia mammillata]